MHTLPVNKVPNRERRLDGRQRTVSEKNLWRSNSLAACSAEDKYAIFYFLTSPFSGTSGTYEIKLTVAAAELGWDVHTQLKPVLNRLAELKLILFDPSTSFVWVKIWWQHNVATQVAGTRLIDRTVDELVRMPSEWLPSYLEDYFERAPSAAQKILNLLKERAVFPEPLAPGSEVSPSTHIQIMKDLLGNRPANKHEESKNL